MARSFNCNGTACSPGFYTDAQELHACWEICRLHNNIGFWVVWLPTAWSITMVYNVQPQISLFTALYRALQYIMTIDDLLDYDVDALVERTRSRAIPRGAISLERAWLFFATQVVVGLCCAKLFLSPTAFYVSAAVYPLYIIYPTCKRWTNLAPIPLGLMFKVGVFMGWADISLDGSVAGKTLLPVYIGACLWTLTYETVYQHQDKLDDIRIGLHSPALLFGEYTIQFCTLTAVGFIGLMSYGGILNGHGIVFLAVMMMAGLLLLTSLWKTDIDRPEDCKAFFMRTPLVGNIILTGLIVDVLLKRWIAGIPF
ncbi:UbiA prenyltransferase [Mycena rebaudengoi]|nr:UbiA prenyltransferase [Mycena rebaudengoi]